MNALWMIVLIVLAIPVALALAVALGPAALVLLFIAGMTLPVLFVTRRR